MIRMILWFKRLIAVAGVLYILTGAHGCTHAQRQSTLTNAAKLSLVDTVDARIDFYESRDEHCREEYPPADHGFGDWRACMDPAYKLKVAVETADRSFKTLQRALDASEADSVRDALPSAIEGVSELVGALVAAGVDIPEEVTEAIALLRSLARIYL